MASPDRIERARLEFAEKIRSRVGVRSAGVVRGFARVPREQFVGPGPWQIVRIAELGRGYGTTPDADPRHLYENVLVALDASRNLNNGEPELLARCLDALDLAPGSRLLHVGCGVGYYTAVAAEAIGPEGRVVGAEIDPLLAERARRNLLPWPQAEVAAPDADPTVGQRFDAIFVNAGATEPLPGWLDALHPGGRLLFPLTVGLPGPELASAGAGHMLHVVRDPDGFPARFAFPVGIFHCAGARTAAGDRRVRAAYERGGVDEVRSLRRDEHDPDSRCWLHAPRFCLSRRPVGG